MNKNFFAGLFIGLGLLAIVAFKPATDEPAPAAQKWDYMTITVPTGYGPKFDEKVKEAGKERWELFMKEGMICYFKRPLE
jgi:hypothetical protein